MSIVDQTPVDTTADSEVALDNAELDSAELNQIKRRSVVGAISYISRTAVLQGIGLVASLLLSAFFSPEDFGIYGVVTQIIGFLVFFSDIGLAAALVQQAKKPTTTEYRTAFTIQQLLSWLIVGLVLIIISTGLVQRKTGQVGVWVLLSLAISFPLATFKTVPSIILERKLDFSKLVLPQIFEQLFFYGVLIVLAWRGMGALAYAYAVLTRSIIGVVVMSIIQPWKIGLALSRSALKQLLNFGAKFQLADFLARIKDQLFFLALGLFLPLREFGYIQWAKTWSQYPYNLTVQNVLAVTFPTFSRLQHHRSALQRAIEKSVFFITLAIFPILAGMVIFIQPLTTVIASYTKWQPAVPSFIMFTLSIGWAALSTPLVNTLSAIGHINKTLFLMLLWTVLTWVLTPIGIWLWGFNGVAMAALAIAVTSVLPVVMVKQLLPVRIWSQVWRQLVAMMGMIGFGLGWQRLTAGVNNWGNWPQILAGMVLAGGVYALLILVLGWKKVATELKSLR